MKRKNKNSVGLWAALLCLLIACTNVFAQDSTKKELVVSVNYFMNNNKVIYIKVNTKTKIDKKFKPVRNSVVNLYLDSISEKNFIAKVTTNERGEAKTTIPPGLKSIWDASATHTFHGVAEASRDFDETATETSITKTKITIDTASDGETRTIKVNVSALSGSEWIPAKDVEMKVGILRLGGILSAGDEETYTTDSTGIVTVELKKDSLPGDEKGNIMLVAKADDNDQYGNFIVETTVPWGVTIKPDNNFFKQRTLWSNRFRTPLWLLFMAYSIIAAVWSVIIYLIFQIIKIKKLGKEKQNLIKESTAVA